MNEGPALATTAASAGPYIGAKLRALEAQLGLAVQRVVGGADDPAAVHDFRVALRRTRTLLEIGRKVLGRFHADEVRRAMRDVQRATGALRDEEVLRDVVTSLAMESGGVPEWLGRRAVRERRLRADVVRLIETGALDRGLELLRAVLTFPIDPSLDVRLSKFVRRSVDRARREVERRRDARFVNVAELHSLRIAYKRLRYTADTFALAVPGLSGVAQTAARFQGKLGDLHDVDVAIACIRRARGLSDAGRIDVLAALENLRSARVVACARDVGLPAVPLLAQAVGTDSLRKISTR